MATLCKRPPLPKKRKKAIARPTPHPEDSQFRNEFLPISDDKDKCQTQQNIAGVTPSYIYYHQINSSDTYMPKSANFIADPAKDRPKRLKRGLLQQWKQTEQAVKQPQGKAGKASFLASFDSGNSFNSSLSGGKRRIIRLHSQKSLKKALFRNTNAPPLDEKLALLKEENAFYKSVHGDSVARLAECENELRRSIDKTKTQQKQFQRKIHELQCRVGRQKRSSNSSAKASRSQFLATFNQISQLSY